MDNETQKSTDDLDRLGSMQLSEYFNIFPITTQDQVDSHNKVDEVLLDFATAMVSHPDDRDLTNNLIQLTIATISNLEIIAINKLCLGSAMMALDKARTARSQSKAEALTQVLIARGLCHLGIDIAN